MLKQLVPKQGNDDLIWNLFKFGVPLTLVAGVLWWLYQKFNIKITSVEAENRRLQDTLALQQKNTEAKNTADDELRNQISKLQNNLTTSLSENTTYLEQIAKQQHTIISLQTANLDIQKEKIELEKSVDEYKQQLANLQSQNKTLGKKPGTKPTLAEGMLRHIVLSPPKEKPLANKENQPLLNLQYLGKAALSLISKLYYARNTFSDSEKILYKDLVANLIIYKDNTIQQIINNTILKLNDKWGVSFEKLLETLPKFYGIITEFKNTIDPISPNKLTETEALYFYDQFLGKGFLEKDTAAANRVGTIHDEIKKPNSKHKDPWSQEKYDKFVDDRMQKSLATKQTAQLKSKN